MAEIRMGWMSWSWRREWSDVRGRKRVEGIFFSFYFSRAHLRSLLDEERFPMTND